MGSRINIRWNSYHEVVGSMFQQMLEEGRYVDVSLACEEFTIKCHRLVLTACSSYFAHLLAQFPESQHVVIYLKDTKHWALRHIVNFIYCGELSVPQDQLKDLIEIAADLKIRGLEDAAQSFESEDTGALEARGQQEDSPQPRNGTQEGVRRAVPPADGGVIWNPALRTVPGRRNDLARKRTLPSGQSNGLPKLTKVQKLDEKDIPANEGKQKSPPPALERFERVGAEPASEEEDEEGVNEEGQYMDENNGEEDVLDNGNDESDEEVEESVSLPAGLKQSNKYPVAVRENVLANLRAGMSVKECSEMSGVPRKTISKWKSRQLQQGYFLDPIDEGEAGLEVENVGEELAPPFPLGPVVDARDRAERLKKATEYALRGSTVRQAAAVYGVPRTTLCAYMKRQGVSAKKPPVQLYPRPYTNNPSNPMRAGGNGAAPGSSTGGNNLDFSLFELAYDTEEEEVKGEDFYEGEDIQ